MEFLLDTHTILWYAQGSEELSADALRLLEREECFYCAASLWEIAIKQKLGKLDAALSVVELDALCRRAGFAPFTVQPRHIERTKSLEFIHRDPFDRLLIAVAQTEDFTIITRDSIISKYDVKTTW